VRINPNEVHCSDIAFADEIYAVGGRKRDKPVHQINGSAYVQSLSQVLGKRQRLTMSL
jgi:hypothetical protein